MTASASTKDVLKVIGSAKGQSLVVAELLEELMGCWGGPGAFAKAFHEEFRASKKGGMIRARMMEAIIKLFITHTANLKGHGDNLGALSEAEIERAVQGIIDRQGAA